MIGVRNNRRHIRFKQTIPYNKKPNSIYKTRRFVPSMRGPKSPKHLAQQPDTLSNGPPRTSITGVK
jgi:hypothetical protein